MAIALSLAPNFSTIRTQSGAVVVDPTGLTTSDYSLANLALPGSADEIVCYWTATGAGTSDTVTLEAIILDVENNRYVVGESASSLKASVWTKLRVYGSGFTIRVAAESVATATDLRIYAAATLPAPPRQA